MADALFLLYALTISLELVLSLLMAAFLYLIVSPRNQIAPSAAGYSKQLPDTRTTVAATATTAASDPTQVALRRALDTIARGENDMQVLIQTRRALQLAEQRARAGGSGQPGE